MPRRGALSVILIVSLAAGAIFNLAVAWACCWWQRPILQLGQVESVRASDEARALWTEVFGPSVFFDRMDGARDLDPATTPSSPIYGAMAFCVWENRWHSLGTERWLVYDMSRSISPGVRVVHAGWPMHAFGCRFISEPTKAGPPRPIWERGGFMVRRGNGMVELPWKPIWPGFAISTMLYGSIVGASWIGVITRRRMIRRRRGLCEWCRYPIGASARCSECGAAVRRWRADIKPTSLSLLMLPMVLSGCASASNVPPPATSAPLPPSEWTTPMGLLGHRLGTYLTIEGVRCDAGKTGTRTMRVNRVNGEALAQPTDIWIDNVQSLPQEQRLRLRGYETGRFIGLPPEVEKALGNVRQAPWQFRRCFVVIPVDVPGSVTLTNES